LPGLKQEAVIALLPENSVDLNGRHFTWAFSRFKSSTPAPLNLTTLYINQTTARSRD
jgi:hypothetical protein